MTSAENSVAEAPNLKIVWGRIPPVYPSPFYKDRANGTWDNAPPPFPATIPPLQKKPTYGPGRRCLKVPDSLINVIFHVVVVQKAHIVRNVFCDWNAVRWHDLYWYSSSWEFSEQGDIYHSTNISDREEVDNHRFSSVGGQPHIASLISLRLNSKFDIII